MGCDLLFSVKEWAVFGDVVTEEISQFGYTNLRQRKGADPHGGDQYK